MEYNPNPNQIKVKEFGKGTLLVEAGPGSGKTTVIVDRINYLIEKYDVSPESFLVITFTIKAANNLKQKLKQTLSKEIVSKMQISTIHSFCLEYLKSKEIDLELIDDDAKEKISLLIEKNKDRLGYNGPATIHTNHIKKIADKFGEYISFNLDDEAFIEELEKDPVSQDYIELADSMKYFSKRIVKYNDFNKEWYKARFHQLIRAYPEYKRILDENGYADFNTLQLKTLEELKKDGETKYKTIFVDEFQDTDPLQYEIFKILEKGSDYFTAVGDVDQHIYGFRSSFIDYFRKMEEDGLVDKKISLNVNYRSTDNIVKVTDEFIKKQRDESSLKELASDNDEYDNPTFLIKNQNSEEESQRIFDLIQHLKMSGKINDYGEVGILYRTHGNATVESLIEKFNQFNEINPQNPIEFTIKGQKDLDKQDEIQSILLMLWYLTRNTNKGYIPSKDELDKWNLTAFCGELFNPTFWSLSAETKQYLCELEDAFHEEIVEVRNDVRINMLKIKRRVSAYKISDNKNYPALKEIFSRVQMPTVDLSKISDKKDRQFFQFLDELRDEVLSDEPPKIFDVFYDLLTYGDFMDDFENKIPQLKNIAILSQTLYNYVENISETDLKGFYFFLKTAIREYTANHTDKKGVQLMTVHSAKGLEFPVTIVLSLKKDSFPMVPKDPMREDTIRNRKDTYYTPLQFLEYKRFLLDEYPDLTWMEIEDMLDAEEEDRVVYVAMTRAADLLVLSSVGEIPEQICEICPLIDAFDGVDDLDDVVIEKHFTNQEDEPLVMTFSKYNLYNSCPCSYNLSYNVGFAFPRKEVTDLGTVFHNALDNVNQKLKVDGEIEDDELNTIIEDAYSSFFDNAEDSEQFNKIKGDILNYAHNQAIAFEVYDSEYPFSVDMEEYTLNGAVDLIYKISDDEIGILDYKNAECNPHKVESYSRQIFTYALALKQLDEFKDYDIVEGRIHFVKSNDEPVFEITEELIKAQEDELNRVASAIKNEEFTKITETVRGGNMFCNTCEFRIFCNKENDSN